MCRKECLTVIAAVAAVCCALPVPDERLQHFEPPQYGQQSYQPPQQYQQPQVHKQPQYKPAPAPYKEEPAKPYAFDYGVRDDYTGANYGHSETSNGNSVEGSYQVALPDGRIQIVKYVADHENGFQAQVEYEGEARYPEYTPHEQQQYKPQPHKSQPQQYKPQVHKPSYKSAPQFHPNEPQQAYPEGSEDTPVYHAEAVEFN